MYIQVTFGTNSLEWLSHNQVWCRILCKNRNTRKLEKSLRIAEFNLFRYFNRKMTQLSGNRRQKRLRVLTLRFWVRISHKCRTCWITLAHASCSFWASSNHDWTCSVQSRFSSLDLYWFLISDRADSILSGVSVLKESYYPLK